MGVGLPATEQRVGGMRNGTRIAMSPARGTPGRAVALRAWTLAILVVAWTGASITVRSDTIVSKSGEVVEGSVVQATRNTLVVRRAVGGMHQMPLRDIEEVRIDRAQGEQISGQLLSWADGVYQIRSGGEVVRISEGRILSRAPLEAERSPTPSPQARGARTVDTAAAAAAAQRIVATPIAATGDIAAVPTAQTIGARTAESDSQTVVLKASVDPAKPGTAGVVFTIELSRPAQQPIVLIYGTVDGTARAGTDYEPQQGVITLAPGTRSTQVRVPLIDHQRSRDESRFELFLAADPSVVKVVDQRIAAIIPSVH
jgi:RNase P/RNase MRP subunit p29